MESVAGGRLCLGSAEAGWPCTRAKKKPLTLANQGFFLFGAGEMNRTPDLLITNELLYRLSYTGEELNYIPEW